MPYPRATRCAKCGCKRTRRTFRGPQWERGGVCTACKNARRRERRKTDLHFRLRDSAQQRAKRVRRWEQQLVTQCRAHDPQSTLTLADVQELHRRQKGRCFWFGVEMRPDPRARFPAKPSVDRLDNSKPHSLENCVLTCFAANIGRNSTPRREWEAFLLELRGVLCSRKSKNKT